MRGPGNTAGGAHASRDWGGLANTDDWLDPGRRVTRVILTQILPLADAPESLAKDVRVRVRCARLVLGLGIVVRRAREVT
jgi:hypothetical protein